jgi:hypothetical protein
MRQRTCAAILAVFALTAPGALGDADWVLDGLPASLLASLQADAFKMEGVAEEEETMSLVSALPTVALGLAFSRPSGYIGLRAGTGMLLNGRAGSYSLFGEADALYEIKQNVLVGPHICAAYFTGPKWWGDGDVEFSDSVGFMLGVTAVMGDKVSYSLTLDYVSLAFDVDEVGPGWTASDDELDLSGIAVKFGVRAKF